MSDEKKRYLPPWKVRIAQWKELKRSSDGGISLCGPLSHSVDVVSEDGFVCRFSDANPDSKATAQLISAAPDLLAALKEAVNIVPLGSSKVAAWITRASDAIEKAEGKR